MSEIFIKQRFTPTDAYLGNPHKGCCTFQHFNGDPLFPGLTWSEAGPTEFPKDKSHSGAYPRSAVEGYLPSTVAYCRWFWELFEPEEGKYDFSVIDRALSSAESCGQTLSVRLMAFGGLSQPQIPRWYKDKYPCETVKFKSAEQIVPVHDSAEYFEKWGNCVSAFAEKYDSDPCLESIDISFIGPWGEGAGNCGRAQIEKFTAFWQKCFPKTPRLALIAGEQLAAGIETGSGWRCDCFGDLKQPGSPTMPAHLSWNHMYDAYPRSICTANAQEAWKNAPVCFETCWVPMKWFQDGFDIDFIIEQGLKYHGTYFMPKYTRLPEEWMKKLASFCRRLGYRYVVRQTKIASSMEHRGKFHFDAWIENIGVAPIYRRYDFAVRFRQEDREEIVRLSDLDIRGWQPGDSWIEKDIPVPGWLKNGACEISMAIIGKAGKVAVKFAVKERYGDDWLPLGTSQVGTQVLPHDK